MEKNQIVEELRHLADKTDRYELNLDELQHQLTILAEQIVPAAIADLAQASNVDLAIVADLASTVESLALTLAGFSDRVTLLERHWE